MTGWRRVKVSDIVNDTDEAQCCDLLQPVGFLIINFNDIALGTNGHRAQNRSNRRSLAAAPAHYAKIDVLQRNNLVNTLTPFGDRSQRSRMVVRYQVLEAVMGRIQR